MSVAADGLDFFELWDNAGKRPEPTARPTAPPVTQVNGNGAHPYAAAALARECDAIAVMGPDSGRNMALNEAVFRMGRHVGAGTIAAHTVRDALEQAAQAAGLPQGEIDTVLRDSDDGGLARGTQHPRPVPPSDYQPPPVTVLDTAELHAFWDTRPALAHIRDFARSRMCSPWAVLGCVLVRVIVATPPFHALPATIGSYASLNLYVALTGPSGTGKGAAAAAARDALNVGHVEVAHAGSGEGIAHLYAHREKGEVIRDREAVLFTIPEVDNLTALGQRQGATLMPQLRMAWSGERLGFAYVDKTKTLPIEEHTYRLGLLLGVQPGRAAPLLDDADGGTPQRFLWMPTTDPDAPEQPPAEPPVLQWEAPRASGFSNIAGLYVMGIPEQARQAIIDAHRAKLRGDADALDGHALLARLKVAAAFALLDQRLTINDQDWDLSGVLMTVSDATRAGVQQHLSRTRKATNLARGEAEAERVVLVSERVSEESVKRVAKSIRRHLTKAGGDLARSDLRRKISHPDRPHLEVALDRLTEVGQVVEVDTDKGVHVVLKEEK